MMHSSVRPYLEYFSLPADARPAGIRWSANGEALESDDSTVRFTRQIADFLDGFASVREIPHFLFILECLNLLSADPPRETTERERFRIASAACREVGGNMRNAGAFFAHLCAEIPPATNVPQGGGKALAHWLTHSPSLGFLHPFGLATSIPGISTELFHLRVAERMRGLTDHAVRHWLRHGVGPQDEPAERIAEEIARNPPTIGEFFEEAMADRSRLSAAAPLVRHFVSALSLPPRRRQPGLLPIGGYADVTSRGDPSRLLPSQFALDPDDFIRRFAENELLYFRREDPQEQKREQLSLVVDQGVLTWGTVRLALAAATNAFARMAEKRRTPFTVRFTSEPDEQYRPPEGNAKRFGGRLEASDLTAHPAEALASELNVAADGERDVIVLTHPRSLREQSVQTLTGNLPEGCRLFALIAAEDGTIEFHQLRDGGHVPISRFRVQSSNEPPPAPLSPPSSGFYVPWSGDVETVPCPFRFGLCNRILGMAFDAKAERLMAVSVGGFPFVWNLSDAAVEVLPRGMHDGAILNEVEAVLGVNRGFVVAGRIASMRVAFHYDFAVRKCAKHVMSGPPAGGNALWHTFPHLDSIVLKANGTFAVDLQQEGIARGVASAQFVSQRALKAVEEARDCSFPAPRIASLRSDHPETVRLPFVMLDPETGQIRVHASKHKIGFTPTINGKSRLKGALAPHALLAENTLALRLDGVVAGWAIHDLGDDGKTLAEYERRERFEFGTLSTDGRLFAHQTGACELTVADVRSHFPVLKTLPGRCHSNLEAWVREDCLRLGIGERVTNVLWVGGKISILSRLSSSRQNDLRGLPLNALSRRITIPGTAGRFIAAYRFPTWDIGLDAFGQAAILRDGRVACMFHYRKKKGIVIWTPDGIFFDASKITDSPETTDTLAKLGELLQRVTSE